MRSLSTIARRLRDIPFGARETTLGDGWPRNLDHADALTYFQRKYKDPAIPEILERFDLTKKRIVSIGSGFGGEEMRMAEGNNDVHCIEPDHASCEFHRACRSRFADTLKVTLHEASLEQFTEKNRSGHLRSAFDLIYSSSPGSWMRGDFRRIIPQVYLDFFNIFGAPDSLIIVKMYGGSHDRFLLSHPWYAHELARKFEQATPYVLKEYWLTDNGTALAIAAKGIASLPRPWHHLTLSGLSARLTLTTADTSSIERRWSDRFVPWTIAAQKLGALFGSQIRKVLSR